MVTRPFLPLTKGGRRREWLSPLGAHQANLHIRGEVAWKGTLSTAKNRAEKTFAFYFMQYHNQALSEVKIAKLHNKEIIRERTPPLPAHRICTKNYLDNFFLNGNSPAASTLFRKEDNLDWMWPNPSSLHIKMRVSISKTETRNSSRTPPGNEK